MMVESVPFPTGDGAPPVIHHSVSLKRTAEASLLGRSSGNSSDHESTLPS